MTRFNSARKKFIFLASVYLAKLSSVTLAVAQTAEFYGVYARDRGRLIRMEESVTDVGQIAFNFDVSFIVYEKWISNMSGIPLSRVIEIRQLFYIRNHVVTSPMQVYEEIRPQSRDPVRPVNKWGAEDFAQPLAILMKPAKGQAEAVEIVPKEPLQPGVYSLRTPAAGYTFSVRFADINKDKACVDMYADGIGAVLGARSYRPCAATPQGQPAQNQLKTPPDKGTGGQQSMSTASLIQDGRREYLAVRGESLGACFNK